jgi:hypothetical protein
MNRLIALLLLAFSQQVIAQDAPVSPGREAAARELVELTNLEHDMMAGATAMMDAMVLQSPQLEDYRDVILARAQSVMSWEVFGPKFVRMYAEAFTEQELRDLIAFYRTPTGKKALTLLPELLSQGAQMGAIEARSRQSELQQMIQRRAEELRESGDVQ